MASSFSGTSAKGNSLFEMGVHHGLGCRLNLPDEDAFVVLCAGDKGSRKRASSASGGWPGNGGGNDRELQLMGAAEHLRTSEDARRHVQACFDEDPGDGGLVRAALNDVARAGNMARLARESGMSCEGLYKALSADGNPTFSTVVRITRALGLSDPHCGTEFHVDALQLTRPCHRCRVNWS